MPLPEDIITKVRQDFSEDDSLLVLQELKELQDEDPDLFFDRILRCIVFFARGGVDQFDKAVKLARIDYRDLIMCTEGHWANNARLFNMPFGICPDEEVFKQWLEERQLVVPWGEGDDGKWTIKRSEIRELWLRRVDQLKNTSKAVVDPNRYFASLHILCIRDAQAISESKAFEAKIFVFYRLHPDTGQFEFQQFYHRPQDVTKRGKW